MQPQATPGSWPFPAFTPHRRAGERPSFFGFVINGSAGLGTLADLYGLKLSDARRVRTFSDYVSAALARSPRIGDRVALGTVELTVLALEGRAVGKVGLRFGRPRDIPPG